MLEIKNLTAGYSDETAAIHDINIKVPKNEICSIIGSNGAGKTTLLKAIMGLLPTSNGEIIFDGNDISKMDSETISQLGIGYVPQGRMIFPYLTVEENLLLGCEVRKMNLKKALEIGYGYFPDLKGISKRKGGMLSGGQQQQLAIARMLVIEPKMIILDEPAEGVQPNVVQEIGRILKNITSELNVSVLLVEQFVGFALNLSSSYYFLQGGQITNGGIITDENRTSIIENIKL
ncbi:ABC transporter ATP-binding protein [Flavobacterium sp. ALD4]|jgi:urea transport system ATP-binding protein|uniref:ATP-binding cassette domain-containing protein n=1 Tax=Flavobacterium sp. ALD4 TaxID=2058314 RepID=UPI000C347C74|nr:ATP-binding cassette domain-containing protein [Flavobacterium sp. ALD4]PKH66946.1 ABC transporter ATP-binding protein [Flavobacterium sp. ALD4]